VLPSAFRCHRQRLGLEGIYVDDAVAVVAAMHPELFETEALLGDVETSGNLTTGTTVFDRRHVPGGQPNMDVAVSADTSAIMDVIVRGLQAAD
jgi:purine nucleosidase